MGAHAPAAGLTMANERLKNELDEALKNVHKTFMVELVDRFEGDLAESDLCGLSRLP